MNIAACVEVVLFRSHNGVADEAVLESARTTQAMIETFDGLLGRQLLKGQDGQWMDIVFWRSREDAERAAHQIMEMPGFMDAMDVVDQSTLKMLHFDPMLDFSMVKQ